MEIIKCKNNDNILKRYDLNLKEDEIGYVKINDEKIDSYLVVEINDTNCKINKCFNFNENLIKEALKDLIVNCIKDFIISKEYLNEFKNVGLDKSNLCVSDILKVFSKEEITEIGNPANPSGDAGYKMLTRMNESHNDVTSFGLSFFDNNNGIYLDIGCGGGNTLSKLLKMTSNFVYGIDISEVSLLKSKEFNLKEFESGRLKLVNANVLNLPFDNDMFDFIVTVESFYFWNNHIKALKEIKRVLKENRKFILIADIYDNGMLDLNTLSNIKKYNLYNPTKEKFEELFINAGFSDVKTYLKEGTTWIVVEGVKKRSIN